MSNDTLSSLLYLLAFGFLLYWMMEKAGCGMHAHGGNGGNGEHGEERSGAPPQVIKDAVCGKDDKPHRGG